jgi:hypothetical protein
MTYDLIVWPVDRAMSVEDAVADLERLRGAGFGLGHDKRLDAFIAEMEARYPGLRGRRPEPPPCEFDVHRRLVFVGIPWSLVDEVVEAVAAAAWRTGVAVFDPQREAVGLPAPFAEAPMSSHGVEPHVQMAENALAAIQRGASSGADDEADAQRAISEELPAAGFSQASPLGLEVAPDADDEVVADPTGVPASLRTAERKEQLIRDLASTTVGDRHLAVGELAGWDPDPEVAAALRPMLASDDVFEASQAAAGLARQGDITDLPAMVELVHRMSPDDGGTVESMLLVLPPALELATLAGPVALDGVRARARAPGAASDRGTRGRGTSRRSTPSTRSSPDRASGRALARPRTSPGTAPDPAASPSPPAPP